MSRSLYLPRKLNSEHLGSEVWDLKMLFRTFPGKVTSSSVRETTVKILWVRDPRSNTFQSNSSQPSSVTQRNWTTFILNRITYFRNVTTQYGLKYSLSMYSKITIPLSCRSLIKCLQSDTKVHPHLD